MPYVDRPTLDRALASMFGTAGHLLKVWLVLKHMGLEQGAAAVVIDTGNSTGSLKTLFEYGDAAGDYYVPFAHTPRYLVMKHDASRSIVQTNVQRWASSGSVVTCDPTGYLDFGVDPLAVSCGRAYPLGLGHGQSGFALDDESRVSVPLTAFAVWYGRQTSIPDDEDPVIYLQRHMLDELRISPVERELVFISDTLPVTTQAAPLAWPEINAACGAYIAGQRERITEIHTEPFRAYDLKVRSMVSDVNRPVWLRSEPIEDVRALLASGAKAILLYGPPRTGKTRIVDLITAGEAATEKIQIHDGWGYDHLVQGYKPDGDGRWDWHDGPLKQAIEAKKKYIVLEEINRTAISQSLGEVFSLIEDAYRGEGYNQTLRDGKDLQISADTIFLMTMNTVDKSTEEIDDALLGRIAAVECPPRPEDLLQMLVGLDLAEAVRKSVGLLFAEILKSYPLGHGYFAGLPRGATDADVVRYYKARIRPVLSNFFGPLREAELSAIDNFVDQAFAR